MPLTITAAATEFVALDELKSHLNITGSRDEAELHMTLGAAQDAVEGLVGPVLHRVVVENANADSRGGLVLRYMPVVSVTSITVDGGAVTYTPDLTTGLLTDVTSTGDAVVTYVAGRAVVPDAIILATLIIGGHLWKTQQGQAPSKLQGDEPVPQYGVGFAIPNRAMDLLAPYLLPPTVA